MLIGRLVGGGSGGGDTPPWSLPGADIDIGSAGALASVFIRFGVVFGVEGGTLIYQLSGNSLTDFEAGTYHEDEPSAADLNEFELRATHISGLALDFGGFKMDIWYSLIPRITYNQSNIAAGNYTSVTLFEIREKTVPGTILASGEYTLTWVVT